MAAGILSLVRREASFLIGALFILSSGLVLTTTSVLKAKLRSDLYLKMSSSVTVAQFALSVALLWFFRSFWMLFVARIIVNTLIVALVATRPAVRLEIGTDKALPAMADGLRAMFMYGLPIILTGLGSKGLQISDRYFVDFFLGKDQTGIYIANYMICDTIGTVLFSPIMMATHNTVINLYAKDQVDQVKVLLLDIKKAILILTLPICSYLAIFHRESSLVFVSPSFAVGSAILPVVTLGIVILNYAMYNLKIFEFQLKSIEITKRMLVSFLLQYRPELLCYTKVRHHGRGPVHPAGIRLVGRFVLGRQPQKTVRRAYQPALSRAGGRIEPGLFGRLVAGKAAAAERRGTAMPQTWA